MNLSLTRHFPLPKLVLCLSLGGGGMGLIVAYCLGWRDIDSASIQEILLALVCGLAGIYGSLRLLKDYIRSPQQISFKLDDLSFGQENIAYADLQSLTHDAAGKITLAWLTDGRCMRLSWDIWGKHEEWRKWLDQATYPHLAEAAQTAIASGYAVQFGKSVRLDHQNLYFGKKAIPLQDITDLKTFDNTVSDRLYRRDIMVHTMSKKHKLNIKKVRNAHVLFGMLREMLSAGRGVVA